MLQVHPLGLKKFIWLNPILPWFFAHSQPGGSLVPPLFIWPSNKLKIGTSISMTKNYSHTQIVDLFLEMKSQWRHFPSFATSLFLVWFCSNFVHRYFLGITNKNTKFCWDWLQNDVINDLKDPILPKYSQTNVLPSLYKACSSAKTFHRGTAYHF